MCEPAEQVAGGDALEGGSDGVDEAIKGPSCDGAKNLLDLGPHWLNWIEVRAVWRQIPDLRTGRVDQFDHAGKLVAGEVIEDDDLAALKRRQQNLLNIDQEGVPVDRAI